MTNMTIDPNEDMPVLPVVDDSDSMNDAAGQPASSFDADRAADAAEPSKPAPRRDSGDDVRSKIAARVKEKRLEEMEADFEKGSDPVVAAGKWGQEEGEGVDQGADPAEQVSDAPRDQPAPQDQQKLIELKVNGRTMRMTEAEIIAEAQKNIAAGDKLELARTLTQELAQARASTTANQRDADDPEAQDDADAEENQLSDEILQLVDDLQTGDKQEAALALKGLMKALAKPDQTGQADLGSQIDAALAEREVHQQQQTFLRSWASENQDVVNDPELSFLVVNRVSESLAQDLVNLGYEPSEIQQLRQASPEELGKFHRKLRNTGFADRLRDPKQIMNEAATGVRQRFGMPQPTERPTPPPANRRERKEALPTQPRSASVAPNPPAGQQPSGRTKASDVVERMRKARGQGF